MAGTLGPYAGRYASITITSSSPIDLMGKWDISVAFDDIDASSFGTTWKKGMYGMQGYSGSFDGFLTLSTVTGSTGQHALINLALSQTKLQSLKLFLNSSIGPSTGVLFWMPNYSTDNANHSTDAGAYIGTFANGIDKNGLATISFNFTGYGPLAMYKDTSSQAFIF
jgi:hypothetical protein